MLAGVAAFKINKKETTETLFFFEKKNGYVHLLLTSFLGVKSLFVNRFSFLCGFYYDFWKIKRMMRALFFLEVSVKFWNDLLGLAKAKRN